MKGRKSLIACDFCGVSFWRASRSLKRSPRHYCCRQHFSLDQRKGERHKGETRICRTCGTAFYVYPSHLRNPAKANLYCSNTCKGPGISAKTKGRTKSPEHRAKLSASKMGRPVLARQKPPTTLVCLHCGESFTFDGRYTYRAKEQRFCGTACWYAHIREHPEQHGSFRGGREPYYGPDWDYQARRARERDEHTCQDCGLHQKRPRLDVHHLIARRDFNREHERANVLDNLITLCKSCHSKREKTLTRLRA